jgi:hypothetical protein
MDTTPQRRLLSSCWQKFETQLPTALGAYILTRP